MPLDAFLPMLALAFASAWTPGPNNVLLAASGARFGLRRTLPHVMGVGLGFPLMVLIVGLFLGQAFQQSPLLQQGLRWGGAALLLWMGWKIANSGAPGSGEGSGSGENSARPFTLLGAAAFQWVNPKGWVMAISTTAIYIAKDAPYVSAAIIAGAFLTMAFSSALGWAWAGHTLAGWLGTGRRLRAFNIVMGAMVALGAVVLLLE